MAHVRMEPDARKQLILDAALKVASGKGGLKKTTRTAIADEAGVSLGLVGHYLGGREELRAAVAAYAIEKRNASILRDAIDLGVSVGYAPRSLIQQAQALRS